MNKIKISHESPLKYMNLIQEFNDYQYALSHLLETNKEYENKFRRYKEEGKEIYLDNSLHELGYPMNNDVLLKWIDILRPSNFFIPDIWEDKFKSIGKAKQWSNIELPEEVTKVAVVQATTLHEAVECVQTYKDLGYKKIAFSYGASYYNDICPHPNYHMGKALGRLYVITTLYYQRILTPSDRVHLLGCASPFEFSLYRNIECIESLDTSNPIMAALDGIRYNSSLILDKPQHNLNSCFDINLDENILNNCKYNIQKFKDFLEA